MVKTRLETGVSLHLKVCGDCENEERSEGSRDELTELVYVFLFWIVIFVTVVDTIRNKEPG